MSLKTAIKLCGWFAAATVLTLAHPMLADTPAFQLSNVLNTQPTPFTGTRGWQFDRYPSYPDVFVTQLGVFDSGGDGLSNAHEVGLWNRRGGTLLAKATIPAGTEATLENGFRWVSIAPVRLPANLETYRIGAQYSAGDSDDLVTPQRSSFAIPIDGLTLWGYYAYSASLTFPGQSNASGDIENPVGETFFEANFQFSYTIPEPAPWALLGFSGVFLLSARRWLAPQR